MDVNHRWDVSLFDISRHSANAAINRGIWYGTENSKQEGIREARD